MLGLLRAASRIRKLRHGDLARSNQPTFEGAALMKLVTVSYTLLLACSMFGQVIPRGPGDSSPETKLGSGDEISIWVRDAPEISDRKYRIEENGEIRLPTIGRVEAGGLTVKELEAALLERLKSQIVEPDVQVSVTEFRSHPVMITGAVRQPGVQEIRDRMTLLQVLTAAGGPGTDAGDSVKISRRKEYGRIPLPSVQDDPSGEFSVAEEDLAGVLDGTDAAARLAIRPGDTVSVPRARIVYVMGEVKRSGGFVLDGKSKEVSTLQALAMAEGLNSTTASPKKALILRPMPGGPPQTVPVDLSKLLDGKGKGEDLLLKPNDILFVPDNHSKFKTIALQAAQSAAAVAVGVTVFRMGR